MSAARRQNPHRRTAQTEDQIEQAKRLHADFSGHEARHVTRIRRQPAHVALAIGELDFVGYTALRDGKHEKYIHRFPKKSRPLLASSHDGSQLEILGGDFQFTEAGIEG